MFQYFAMETTIFIPIFEASIIPTTNAKNNMQTKRGARFEFRFEFQIWISKETHKTMAFEQMRDFSFRLNYGFEIWVLVCSISSDLFWKLIRILWIVHSSKIKVLWNYYDLGTYWRYFVTYYAFTCLRNECLMI